MLFHHLHGVAPSILAEYGLDVVEADGHGMYMEGRLEQSDDMPEVESSASTLRPLAGGLLLSMLMVALRRLT